MRRRVAELSDPIPRVRSEYTAVLRKYNVGMADELLRYRSQFPILERTTYLISNSLGAMPQAVYDAMKGYADIWATRGVRAWEERWWMLAAQVGDEIGALMNAPPGSVSTHQNVTTCQAVVASCFDFSGNRNKVVYSDLNFPSVMYFWEAQQAGGARVHMVPTDDGITVPTERLLDAIDEQTLLVPVSHVIFRSAYIQDAKAIIEKAHRVGAHVVLDTFQSLGTVPVDVQALNVDFTCGGVLKWLCGGPGVAYLYVRPDLGKKAAAKIHRLVCPPESLRLRDRTHALCRATLPLHEWHLPHSRSGSGAPGTEDHRRGRHRAHPREVEAPDFTPDRVGLGARMARQFPTQRRTSAAERFRSTCPMPRKSAANCCKRDILVDYRPKAGRPHVSRTSTIKMKNWKRRSRR